jgi:hypothetical protein
MYPGGTKAAERRSEATMAAGRRRLGAVLGVALVVAACSSDESGVLTADGSIVEVGAAGSAGAPAEGGAVEGGGGTGTDAAAVTDAVALDVTSDVGAMCNTVVNSATVVTATLGAGAVPALTGGTIADGTYTETKIEQFGGDGGLPPAEQSTIVISAGTLHEVVKIGTVEARYFSTYTVMMSTITIVTTCDSTFKFTGGYSAAYQASPTTFIYAFDSNGGKQVKTYTKK